MQITPMIVGFIWTIGAACNEPAVTSKKSRNSVAALASSSPSHDQSAQLPVVDSVSLRTIGQQTLDALRNGDAAFLASAADEKGVALGTDNPVTPASEFRRELNSKTGAYCDLFGCNGTPNSVRALLSGKTVEIRAVASPGAAHGQVDVFEAKRSVAAKESSGSALVTLFFENRKGAWRLTGIEYI